MAHNQNSLTKGNVMSALIKFAIPFLLASILQALYGAVDLLVVGQFADSVGMSAVSTGSQVMQTITGIILGLTTGGTVLIGQYIGAGQEENTSKTVGSMICVFGAISIVLTVVTAFCTNILTDIMKAPAEAVESTRQYIFICSLGIPFIIAYNTLSGILRGAGDSKSPLWFIFAATIFNIVGDLLLVAVFDMGAAGAAIATIGAQAFSLIFAYFYYKKCPLPFHFERKYLHFYKEIAKKSIAIGMPIAVQTGFVSISFLIITAIINNMSLEASASVGVVEKIITFGMLPTSSIASAISTMAAQNMGANQPDRAKKSLNLGILFSLVIAIVLCIYCQIYPESLTGVFSNDQEVIRMSALYLKSYSYDFLLVSFVFCYNSFFSGCGHTTFPLLHSLIATFIIRIPASYFISTIENVSLYYMGLAAPAASVFSIIACVIYMMSGKWKENTVVQQSDSAKD